MLEELVRTTRRTELDKRWRNKWRAITLGLHIREGHIIHPGEEYWGLNIWPTREIAEQKAIESDKDAPPGSSQYLGAFPHP